MIISFSLENWMSFRNKVTFSMVASRERQHGNRVPKLGGKLPKVLPIAAIYGGNASGKSNFFKALDFAKELVVKGTQPDSLIPVKPFRLDAKMAEQPSRFAFVLCIDKRVYEFSFAVTRKAVVEEKLVEIIATDNERTLYHRTDGKPNFDSSLFDNSLEKTKEFYDFVFKGTRDNQLFLTNSVSQNVSKFRPIFDWFKNTLELVGPNYFYEQLDHYLNEGHPFHSAINEILPQLDTGISRLAGEELNYPSPTLLEQDQNLQEKVKEGMAVNVNLSPINQRCVITRKDGKLIAKKLVTYHAKADGTEASFEIREESDGTQRVIDLLPAFLELSAKSAQKVYVIDEIDRSLHTLLIRRLLEAYLTGCSAKTRAQLLLTTHNVLLMDQQLLRRDEMWVAERDSSGSSNLLSFSEYKDVRYDKDIRKSYLQGRLGGIPRILWQGALSNPGLGEESEGDD